MPRENKTRGRKAEKKRKATDEASNPPVKRQRPESEIPGVDIVVGGEAGDDFISLVTKPSLTETPFYGLLTDEEQEYYAGVNNKIEANDFESDEDRAIFIEAVHRESQGKELRVASSQSCSRYLEKVMHLSTSEQLKALFSKFLGDLTYLVQHRFASHCCETLFSKAAPFVGNEAVADTSANADELTLETLFLSAVEELEPNVGYLLTERFASHALRVLLLVLSGEPLEDSSTKSVLASRRKENLGSKIAKAGIAESQRRHVPPSFRTALEKMVHASISTLDTTYLRALATHPTGNPVLQLLLRLELTIFGKSKAANDKSLLKRLLPDENLEDGSESAKFVHGLQYDPTGSRLLETVIQYAPGKTFKKLYRNLFKERMGSLARNDIAGYVVIKILERVGKEDLADARDQILPNLPNLIDRQRTGVIKVLVERSAFREIDMAALAESLKIAYGEHPSHRLLKMLRFEEPPRQQQSDAEEENAPQKAAPRPADLHGSLLAQAMLQGPAVSELVYDSLLAMSQVSLLRLAKDPIASRVLQEALIAKTSTQQFRRQFVTKFYGAVAELAVDIAGSHFVDALWAATNDLHFIKERVAEEFKKNESLLRESRAGRIVWRNWSMDMYIGKHREWQALAKQSKYQDVSSLTQDSVKTKSKAGESSVDGVRPNGSHRADAAIAAAASRKTKTPLELARERFAAKKAAQLRQKRGAAPQLYTNA